MIRPDAAELRYALRRLRRRPGFTAVVVGTLAIGIGANAAIFSVVNRVLLQSLPYPDVDRIVVLRTDLPAQGVDDAGSSGPELLDLRQRATAFEALGSIWYRPAALTDDATAPEDIDMAFVNADLLPALGVSPYLGRFPTADEDVAGGPRVIVLSHHLWARRYGGDPGIVGRRIEMDAEPHTVVGVMPEGFRLYFPPDVGVPPLTDAWVPFGGAYEQYPRTWRVHTLVGRLRPDTSPQQANLELGAIAAELAREYAPDYEGTGLGLRAEAIARGAVDHVRPLLWLLFGAVGCVLLIVCANVANLYLARAAESQREVAIRSALGASRTQLLRQLAVECLLITAIGAVGGLLIARWCIALLPVLAPADLPRLDEVSLDARVLAFIAVLAAGTALAFATASSLAAGTRTGAGALRGGRRVAGRPGRGSLRGALLVAELALSLMLLIGVGLMVRSFGALARVDPGFEPENVVTFKLSLVDSHYPYAEPQRIAGFYRQLAERLAAAPGVVSSGVTTQLPMDGALQITPYAFEAAGGPSEWGASSAAYRVVTPGWFDAIGARLANGRGFLPSDDLDSPNVVIVDRALARRAWPGRNPVGERLQVEVFVDAEWRRVWAEVIGIVESLRHDPTTDGVEQVYIPHAQSPMRTTVLTVRSANAPRTVADAVAAAVGELNPDQPVGLALPLSSYVAGAVAAPRFALTLLSAFSAIALLLAIVGTYGVTAYGVARRYREIGVKIALGATPRAVVGAIVRQGAHRAALGVLFGVVGAVALTRFLEGLLYDVTPTDPLTFALVSLLMGVVTVVACYVPARRAARLDPKVVLNAD